MHIDIAKTWNIFVRNIPLFQYGIEMTLLFAFVGTFAGFVVGLLVGGIRAIEINEYDDNDISDELAEAIIKEFKVVELLDVE